MAKNPRYTILREHHVRVFGEAERLRNPPPECIDVWQVCTREGVRSHAFTAYHGILRDLEQAIKHAVHLRIEKVVPDDKLIDIHHKAAVELPDGFHLIHFNTIRFHPGPVPEAGAPSIALDPTTREWLAARENKPNETHEDRPACHTPSV